MKWRWAKIGCQEFKGIWTQWSCIYGLTYMERINYKDKSCYTSTIHTSLNADNWSKRNPSKPFSCLVPQIRIFLYIFFFAPRIELKLLNSLILQKIKTHLDHRLISICLMLSPSPQFLVNENFDKIKSKFS
jgi:hypothetical protein